jgi:hypothetical protein
LADKFTANARYDPRIARQLSEEEIDQVGPLLNSNGESAKGPPITTCSMLGDMGRPTISTDETTNE